MPFDLDAVGRSADPQSFGWSADDCLLYALAVGAGAADPLAELEFTTENSAGRPLRVLPTFPVVAGPAHTLLDTVGDLDWTKLVHAEQSVTIHRELRPAESVTSVSRLSGIWDKGSGALIEMATDAHDSATGEPVYSTTSAAFVRGAGGWGGERGRSSRVDVPDRAPDARISMATRPDQALLYRLCGDHNPLHSDPLFAAEAGFERPILHGLCSFGFAGRALVAHFGSDARITSISGRFTRPVYPGDTLDLEIWPAEDGAIFRVLGDGGQVVIDSGVCRAI